MAKISNNNTGVEEFGGARKVNSGTVNSGDVAMLRAQAAFEKNKNLIIGVVVAILLAVGGFFGYKYFIQKPNEEKATRTLTNVQNWFANDSLKLVINGDGQSQGGLSVMKKYSGTAAANLAHFYVGVAYLKTGDANNAIKYLEDFDGKGTIVDNLADGALGDAYMDAGKLDKALDYYKKAASDEKNQYVSALYTFRAGLACEQAGKKEDAIKYYKTVKEKFPQSPEANTIDKYLARVGVLDLN